MHKPIKIAVLHPDRVSVRPRIPLTAMNVRRRGLLLRRIETEQHAHAAPSIESLDDSINTVRFRSAVPSELVDGFMAPDA